jgi:hypothetical protein
MDALESPAKETDGEDHWRDGNLQRRSLYALNACYLTDCSFIVGKCDAEMQVMHICSHVYRCVIARSEKCRDQGV